MSKDKRPIRHVQNLDPLSADVVSLPTKELEERIRILENALAGFSRKGSVTNVILKSRPIRSDVELYNAVYYNPTSGTYEKAVARVEFSGTAFKTLPSSLVQGIVVKVVGTTADILVDGAWPSAVFKQGGNNLLEAGEPFQAGKPYYLSSDQAGRITFRPPALAVQVLLTTDDSLLMNKVYGSPEGFEKAARFEMGLRPIGSLRTIANEARIVGFNALECGTLDGVWTKSEDNPKFNTSGYMVAEGEAVGVISSDLWVEILTDTSGHITVHSASSLAQLQNPNIRSEVFSDYNVVADDTPFAVNLNNHEDIRSYLVRDSNNVAVQRIKFKYVCNQGDVFDLTKNRSVIFQLPNTFMGWKEIYPGAVNSGEAGNKYQIQPYYLSDGDCDYPDFQHTPTDSSLYYATKGDFGFIQNWPAEPLDKAIIMVNGVEMDRSELLERGLNSEFKNPKFDMGISIKSLYWPTSYVEASPWTLGYEQIVAKVDGSFNTEAAITHRSAEAGKVWCWQESLHSYEPFLNKGWVYTNKLSVYSKSTRVLGIGVMPPLRVRDMITGLEPSYTGEPIGGNLLLWSEDKDNVLNKVQDIDLGRYENHILYTNDTKFNVAVKDITFVVRSQNNAELSNQELGQIFTESDYALIDLGTGSEGGTVYNIAQRVEVKVLEYNTSAVLTLDKNTAVVPPKGVVRLSIYRPFDVEQTVSVIFAGRTI